MTPKKNTPEPEPPQKPAVAGENGNEDTAFLLLVAENALRDALKQAVAGASIVVISALSDALFDIGIAKDAVKEATE